VAVIRDHEEERIARLETLLEELRRQQLDAGLRQRIDVELERLRIERLVLRRHLIESAR
jgi:hypothetical protein